MIQKTLTKTRTTLAAVVLGALMALPATPALALGYTSDVRYGGRYYGHGYHYRPHYYGYRYRAYPRYYQYPRYRYRAYPRYRYHYYPRYRYHVYPYPYRYGPYRY